MLLLVCFFIDEIKLHYSFSRWPLHITIVPWFEITNSKLPMLIDLLDKTSRTIGRMELTTDVLDKFGEDHSVSVMRLNENLQLDMLHRRIMAGLKPIATLESERYVLDHYKPHISVKDGYTISSKVIEATKLFVVAKLSNSTRQVVHIVDMKPKEP